jgi:hypothetical protein
MGAGSTGGETLGIAFLDSTDYGPGEACDIGLGSLSVRSLAEVRQEAAELRSRARLGEDIMATKQVEKRKAMTPTFEQAAAIVHQVADAEE